MFPCDAPEHQPMRWSYTKIDGNKRFGNGLCDVVLLQFTHGQPKESVGHSPNLIPKEGLPFDFKANQSVSSHPWLCLKDGPDGVLSFLQTCEITGVVGPHEEVKPSAKIFVIRFDPEFQGFQTVAIGSVECHAGIEILLNLLDRQQRDVWVQSIVNSTNHFSGREGLPKRAFQIHDAAVDTDMHTGIGSAREDQQLFIFRTCQPL